jgi:hypothetical protein
MLDLSTTVDMHASILYLEVDILPQLPNMYLGYSEFVNVNV